MWESRCREREADRGGMEEDGAIGAGVGTTDTPEAGTREACGGNRDERRER